MRFLTLYRPETGEEDSPADAEHQAAMSRFVEEMTRRGALLDNEPIAARAHGARVRLSGGRFTVEQEQERMSGYAFLQAGSREEAIELAKEFLQAAGDGVAELRQVVEFGPRTG